MRFNFIWQFPYPSYLQYFTMCNNILSSPPSCCNSSNSEGHHFSWKVIFIFTAILSSISVLGLWHPVFELWHSRNMVIIPLSTGCYEISLEKILKKIAKMMALCQITNHLHHYACLNCNVCCIYVQPNNVLISNKYQHTQIQCWNDKTTENTFNGPVGM